MTDDDIDVRLMDFLGAEHEALAVAIAVLARETMCDVTMRRSVPGGRTVEVRTQRSRIVPAGNGGRRKPRRVILRVVEVASFNGGGSGIYRAIGQR
jgi:hypothetical protein